MMTDLLVNLVNGRVDNYLFLELPGNRVSSQTHRREFELLMYVEGQLVVRTADRPIPCDYRDQKEWFLYDIASDMLVSISLGQIPLSAHWNPTWLGDPESVHMVDPFDHKRTLDEIIADAAPVAKIMPTEVASKATISLLCTMFENRVDGDDIYKSLQALNVNLKDIYPNGKIIHNTTGGYFVKTPAGGVSVAELIRNLNRATTA